MLRSLILSLLVFTLSYVAPVKAEYFPGCPTLGGINVQQAINYFKALPHPHLWTNFHDAANVADAAGP